MYAPKIRMTRVAGRMQDPYDFLAEMISPPPLPSDDEIALILAKTPPEDIVVGMDRQPNGEYLPANIIVLKR